MVRKRKYSNDAMRERAEQKRAETRALISEENWLFTRQAYEVKFMEPLFYAEYAYKKVVK
ncbi:hypothetical protein HMI54_012916, partial [Coelomomyces lativittatus]